MGARPPRHFRARLASSPLPLREGPDDIALRESPSNRAGIDDGERPEAPVGHEAHHLLGALTGGPCPGSGWPAHSQMTREQATPDLPQKVLRPALFA